MTSPALRSQYLKNHWRPYPSWQEVVDSFGQLEGLEKGRLLQLTEDSITLNEKTFVVSPLVVLDQSQHRFCDVLNFGDLVAVFVEYGIVKKITLLSPNQNDTQMLNTHNQKEILKNWMEFKDLVIRYFQTQGFLLVDTPTLVVSPGTEPSLEVFETELKFGNNVKKMFLPTSPELHLKKLLAKDISPIFEIKNCFRNNEITATHQPEFTMLEWYRSYSSLSDIKNDLIGLLQLLNFKIKKFPEIKIVIKSMSELFGEILKFELTPKTTLAELKALAAQYQIPNSDSDWDDLFYRIFVDRIESSLHSYHFLIVKDYPPSQAALARKNKQGWGERFELYINGIEICNAFDELNDPVEQRNRFALDLQQKQKWGRRPVEIDEDFLKALESGMPPAAGIALGLERLFMVFYGIQDIADVKAFPERS